MIRSRLATVAMVVSAMLAAAMISVTTGSESASANTTTFSGPLQPGYSADPDIVYYSGEYYELDNQNIDAQINLRIAPSIALLASVPNTTVYTADPQTHGDIGWGGFFFHYNSHWFIYDNEFSVSPDRAFVLESSGDSPAGPYSFKAQLAGPGSGNQSYVNTAFINNGQLYTLQTADSPSGHGIYIATMSDPWTVSSSFTLIADPTNSWENGIDEGSSVNIHGGSIYDVFSAGTFTAQSYCVGMLTASTSANLLSAGSWTKSPGCVFSSSATNKVWGPGSMTWFTSPDGTQDWVAYHGKISPSTDSSGDDRQITAEQVTWNGSGNPVFGSPVGFETPVTLPSGDPGAPTGVGNVAPVPGGLTNVSAASDGTVVGVAPDNRVWQYTGSGSLPWTEITGKALTRLAVRSANDIWGLDSSGSIWRYNGSSWSQIAGNAFDIAAGADGSVWATASGGTYQWSGGTSTTTWQSNWNLVAGSAPGGTHLVQQVSGRSATDLWGVDSSTNIWHFNGTSWTQVAGGLIWVSEGSDGSVYGVAPDNRVWEYTGTGALPWVEAGGSPVTQISVSSNTNRWSVDGHTNVWRTI
jgi:GH43 family beta-xylosidase